MSTMIPFITQKDQIKNTESRLIPGAKICVFDPVTNNPVEIKTYDSAHDTYVTAQNPIYLNNESRPSQTYFADRLVLCVLYEYQGNFGDPMADDDDADWKFVRNWLGAFSTQSVLGNGTLHGLSELMEADPQASPVTVVGYWTDDDCEARTYVWNPTSVAEPDNGYIVKSNNEDTGRWILEFDGEWLPSTYYGVYPGREANINALLTYPAQIGSELTAPGIYFKPGEYSGSTVALVTDKKVLIDANTRFTRDDFTCRWVNVVGEPELPICDFYVEDKSCPVHSSWYKSCVGFWMSGSDHLYIDKENHQTNKNIQNTVTVQDRTIYGQNRLSQTYGQNGRLYLDGCSFVGENMFSSDDKLRFAHTEFTDSIFSTSSASLDFTDGVIVRSSGINQLRLENFKNVVGYIHAILADGQTILDLAGRPITQAITILNSPFVKIRNIYSDYQFSISNGTTYDLNCENCHLSQFYFGGRYLDFKDCDISFPMEPNTLQAVWAYRSSINGSYKFTKKNIQWSFEDCTVSISFETADNNNDDEMFKIFKNCIIGENCLLKVKRLQMINCTTTNNSIQIYPYKTTQDNVDTYHLYAFFEGNRFNNSSPITFTRYDIEDGWESKCYECMIDWTFRCNDFRGNDSGISCRYWANRLGSYYNKEFIGRYRDNHQEYVGNTGSCPADNAQNCYLTNGTGCEESFYWVELGNDQFQTLDKRNPARVMMDMSDTGSIAYHAWSRAINGNGFPVRTRYTGNDNADFNCGNGCYIYPWSHLNDNLENGDLFKVAFSKFGKVRENDPSYYPWTWRFLQGLGF